MQTDQVPLRVRCGHLAAAAAITVVLPVVDLLARQPQFWVAHQLGGPETMVVTAALLLLVPLPCMAVEAALRWTPRLAWAFHLLAMALSGSLLALLVLRRLPPIVGSATAGIAAAAGALLAWAYHRRPLVRRAIGATGFAALGVAMVMAVLAAVRDFRAAATIGFDDLPRLDTETPVVVVVFDGLALAPLLDARGELDRARLPGFAALADHALWFRHTAAAAAETKFAVPAILTGRRPDLRGVMSQASHPHNLFTLFARSHRLLAFEPVSELCPPALDRDRPSASAVERLTTLASDLTVIYGHLALPVAWIDRLPPIDNAWKGFAAATEPARREGFVARAVRKSRGDRRADLERFLAALGEARGPTVHVIHTLLPHRPWNLLPSGQRYPASAPPPGLERGRWHDDPYALRQARAREALQIGYLDRFVGRLVETLRAHGRFDETLIVLTADHGGAIRAGRNPREHHPDTLAELVPVPLWIKPPHSRSGTTIDRPVSALDIVPTLLALLEVESPWPFDGRSALAASGRDTLPFVDMDDRPRDLEPVLFAELPAVAARLAAERGDADDPFGLFRHGPHGDLVGQPVAAFDQPGPSAWFGALARGDDLASLELASDVLPALLEGHLRQTGVDPGAGSGFAIALNGTVAATAPWPAPPSGRSQWRPFTALLPPRLLVDGTNQVELFEIRRPRARVRLRPIAMVKPQE